MGTEFREDERLLNEPRYPVIFTSKRSSRGCSRRSSPATHPLIELGAVEQITRSALNAVIAVIRWKKLCGFYMDDKSEHHTIYVLGGNVLINEDTAELVTIGGHPLTSELPYRVRDMFATAAGLRPTS